MNGPTSLYSLSSAALFEAGLITAVALALVLAPGETARATERAPLPRGEQIAGPTFRPESLAGRPWVVDFFASWCEPCKAAIPHHAALIALHGGRLGFVAVSLDEDDAAARAFVARFPLAAPTLHDPTGVTATAFGVSEMPYAVLVAADGTIAARFAGEPYPRLAEAAARLVDSGCPDLVEHATKAMGSSLALRICPAGREPAAVQAAIAEAVALVRALERLWSTWVPESDISRLNRAAGGPPVPIDARTHALLARSVEGSRKTGGLFDVTFAPLGAVWKFDTPPGDQRPTRLERVPTAGEVDALRAHVGIDGLELSPAGAPPTARLARPGMAVHLGGIGKGAAVDAVVALLRNRGLHDFCVQAGGDLCCAGRNGQRPWRVGIAHPRKKGALLGSMSIGDAAFSTSGDYERFALIDGRRYHHILDPRTGYPAMASQSATVRVKSATDAEVLTKAAFILGGAAGLDLLVRAGASGVIVDADGRRWSTPDISLDAP
ncbi:FAD:protein FMN transferase [Myxococcota bacterium]|nr:FAD:protein FMN transferase [Myxococcota bacterium]